MRTISFIGITMLVFGMAVGVTACSDDETGDGSGGSGNSASTNSGGSGSDSGGSGSANGGSGSNSGGSGATGGSGAGGGPAGGLSFCGKSCTTPADCCFAGVPDCPSDTYPNNWGCEEGLCTPPQCAADADCTFGGALPDNACLTVSDFKGCLETCETDADCTPGGGTTCIGVDDDGVKYCSAPATGGCTADADCTAGYGGHCDVDSGACTCEGDRDCSGAGVDTCVAP